MTITLELKGLGTGTKKCWNAQVELSVTNPLLPGKEPNSDPKSLGRSSVETGKRKE